MQGISRQADAAFYIVLAAVGRTADDVAIFAWHAANVVAASSINLLKIMALLQWVHRAHILFLSVLLHQLVADAVNHVVVIIGLIGLLIDERIACRIIEHHDVIEFHVAQTLYAAVIPVRPLYVALHVDQRHGVLGERHGERSFRNARAVAYLAHEEIIARKETLFERGRRNDVVLEEEEVDEINRYESEHQRIYPAHDEAHRAFLILPPLPVNLLGDVNIEDERNHDESQPAFYPNQKEEIEGENHCELRPLYLHIEFLFLLVYHNFCLELK